MFNRTRDESRRLDRNLALVAFVIALLVGVGPAVAAPQIYHSPADNGIPAAGQATVPEGGIQSVYLYVDGGSSSSSGGSACDTGEGDEVCGYELLLSGLSGLTLASFTPDSGADIVFDLGSGAAIVNGLDTLNPSPGPQRIGELQVNASPGGYLRLSGGSTVGADLSEDLLPISTLVTVPEPAEMLLLGSGLALLGLLGRLGPHGTARTGWVAR